MLDRYQMRFLAKGSVIRGSIEIPAGVQKEQVDQIINLMRTYYTGPDAERDVMVLPDGAKLNNNTLNPQQSQLIEQTTYTDRQISQITGVPPQFLYNFSESKYNDSIEQMGQDVVRNTFRPWMEQVEDELSTKLLSESEQDNGYRVHLDPSALLRGDTNATNTAAVSTVNAGIRTPNEARMMLCLPPLDDPTANKVHALGSTKPQDEPKAKPDPASAYAALQPVIDAAIARVEAKTTKAFTNAASKTGEARIIWANVFAEDQARYVADALDSVSTALISLNAPPLPVPDIAAKYGASIRRRASTNDAPTLTDIVTAAMTKKETDETDETEE